MLIIRCQIWLVCILDSILLNYQEMEERTAIENDKPWSKPLNMVELNGGIDEMSESAPIKDLEMNWSNNKRETSI